MKNRLCLLVMIIIHFCSLAARAEFSCESQKCPDGYKNATVCLAEPNMEGLHYINKFPSCGYLSQKYVIERKEDFESSFKDIASKCMKIKTLRFYGHGTPRSIMSGRLSINELGDLSRFACAMAPDANIELIGCSNGRGCTGQLLMYEMAQALLPKGGRVRAPTADAIAILLLLPTFSDNGQDRVLEYNPKNSNKAAWKIVAPYADASSRPPISTIVSGYKPEVCADRIKGALDDFERLEKSAQKAGCDLKESAKSVQSELKKMEPVVRKMGATSDHLDELLKNAPVRHAVLGGVEELDGLSYMYMTCASKNEDKGVKKDSGVDAWESFLSKPGSGRH